MMYLIEYTCNGVKMAADLVHFFLFLIFGDMGYLTLVQGNPINVIENGAPYNLRLRK